MKAILSTIKYLFCILLLLATTNSCTPILNVEDAYIRTIDFDRYQTYAWYVVQNMSISGNPEGEAEFNRLIDDRIKEAVESELVKNNIKPTVEDPSLLVAYDITIETGAGLSDSYTLPPGFGYGYAYWFGYRYNYNYAEFPDYKNIQEYPVGTLVIDLIDADTNELVWRGWAQANFDPTILEERTINRVVANIMAQFPPIPRAVR